ncbi:unnamed protein product [Chrysoparadoxa australica]
MTCTRVGLDSDKRLFKCRSSENCVSTSSVKSPDKFASPWNYGPQTTSSSEAYDALVSAIKAMPGAQLRDLSPGLLYLRVAFPSTVPPGSEDIVEFVLRAEDNVVLFRSATRDSVFVYPLQQPLSDQNSNRERLEQIRTGLGWASLSYGDGVF